MTKGQLNEGILCMGSNINAWKWGSYRKTPTAPSLRLLK